MKFDFERDALLHEMLIAQEAVNSKNSMDILANALLILEGDSLVVKTKSRELTFQCRTTVDGIEDGCVIVYASKFIDILKVLPSGFISFETVDNKEISLRHPDKRKIHFSLKILASEKFPDFELNTNDSAIEFSIIGSKLKTAINTVISCVSTNTQRLFMCGVHFEGHDNSLHTYATDGRKLAVSSVDIDTNINGVNANVPVKILNVVSRYCNENSLCKIVFKKNAVYFSFENYNFSSLLFDGQFPNTSRVIPQSSEYSASVDKNLLNEALKRVSLMCDTHANKVTTFFSTSSMQIESCESTEGAASEIIPCSSTCADMAISLNYNYLLAALKAIQDENVLIGFTEAMKPITVKPANNNEGEKLLYVIMPMVAN